MVILTAVRSGLFYALFIGQTAIIALVIGTIAAIAPGRTGLTWPLARYWCRSNVWLMRWVAGIGTDVSGEENIPEGGCIIASKHQSDWDVFAIFPHTVRPAYIVKRELMRIPFFGAAARSLDCIEVDRKKGAEAIPAMMREARDKLRQGCRIVIFPEGTRKPPAAAPEYRSGVSRMYAELQVPVVPVALNSGLFWGRNSLLLWPGTARARILPPIPPGLSPAEFQERLVSAIETESNRLTLAAVSEGLTRDLPPDVAARVAALGSAQPTTSTPTSTTRY